MATVGRTKECTIVPSNHFGPIPGVEVGTLWKFRVQVGTLCSLTSACLLASQTKHCSSKLTKWDIGYRPVQVNDNTESASHPVYSCLSAGE